MDSLGRYLKGMKPILYNFRRCPYAMRARLAIAVSGVEVELREILLRDKAAEFLTTSPKGTVPVIVDGDTVLEESYEIMLWALHQSDPEGWLERSNQPLIDECDDRFKTALDAYKYNGNLEQREIASEYLRKLESFLTRQPNLSGEKQGMTDMAIITFVRQFANVDRAWFDAEPWPHLIKWLEYFLASDQFAAIMTKYPKWQSGDSATLFPEPK